jgi:hypothetical protein
MPDFRHHSQRVISGVSGFSYKTSIILKPPFERVESPRRSIRIYLLYKT